MGILNVTPDSFYDGGKYTDKEKALKRAEEMIAHGADIIDVGGESTRPGSLSVSADEEMKRVIPVVDGIRSEFDVIISVDTTKSEVAKAALDSGASIINDISGLNFEPEIADHVAAHDAYIILMHTSGRPLNMQDNIKYNSLIVDILDYLKKSIIYAVRNGINKDKIIIDPGIGFGKTVDDNIKIISELRKFMELDCPILIGTSRKSFIGKIINESETDKRLIGSVITAVLSVLNGATIVRVHDVKETRQALNFVERIYYH